MAVIPTIVGKVVLVSQPEMIHNRMRRRVVLSDAFSGYFDSLDKNLPGEQTVVVPVEPVFDLPPGTQVSFIAFSLPQDNWWEAEGWSTRIGKW